MSTQSDKAFERTLKRKGYVRCPKCNKMVLPRIGFTMFGTMPVTFKNCPSCGYDLKRIKRIKSFLEFVNP